VYLKDAERASEARRKIMQVTANRKEKIRSDFNKI
jgi:hypothetical protein